MIKYLFVLAAFICINQNASSQSDLLGFGFRAGLSIAKFDGPSEMGPNGESLETFSMSGGFHIGAMINFKFTDLVGMRTELMYSQRGTEYVYEGPSYYLLGRNTVLSSKLGGSRKQTTDVSNAYLDIPVLAYYKLGRLEILGGFNTGLLLASTGGGTMDYTGVSPLGNSVAPFRVNLNHNYKKDEAGQGFAPTQKVDVDGRDYDVPSAVGAYYDFETKNKNLYKTLDFGLVAGASYFVNSGLFIGVRYIHGLGDVDRNEYDISLQTLNPNESYVQRSDENKSRSFQFSVGFAF